MFCCPPPPPLEDSVPADGVLPRHLGLLVPGGGRDGLGDLAGQRTSTLFLWHKRGFGGKGRAWLIEGVERGVGVRVGVEVVGGEIGQAH